MLEVFKYKEAEKKKGDGVIIAHDHERKDGGISKKFIILKDIEEYKNKRDILNNSYEIIDSEGNTPARFLLDIEHKTEHPGDLKAFYNDIEDATKEALKDILNIDNIFFVWFSSNYECGKFSRHFLVCGVAFHNWADMSKIIYNKIYNIIGGKWGKFLDGSIYSKKRQIRLIYSYKHGKPDGVKLPEKKTPFYNCLVNIYDEEKQRDIIIKRDNKIIKDTIKADEKIKVVERTSNIILKDAEKNGLNYYIDDLRKYKILKILNDNNTYKRPDKKTINRREDYGEKRAILRALKSLGLVGWDIWEKWRGDHDKEQWAGYFNSGAEYWSETAINYIYNIVGRTKAEIYPTKKIKFFDTSKFEKIYIEKNKYISEEAREEALKYKNMLFVSPTGTGKTVSSLYIFNKLIEKHPEIKILSLVCRRTQGQAHKEVFKELNFNFYMDNATGNIPKYDPLIWCGLRFIVQIDSVARYQENDFRRYLESDYILYIDEVRSVLSHIYTSFTPTMLKNRTKIIKRINDLIKNASYFIAVDADLSTYIIKNYLFNFIDEEETFIYNNTIKQETTKDLNIYYDFKNIVFKMIEEIKAGNYFVSCFDSVAKLNGIIQTIKDNLNDNDLKHFEENKKIYTATRGTLLNVDINEEWKNKYIFYSPTITTGIDYQGPEPQSVFIISTGFSIDAFNISQQGARCRKIKDINLYVEETGRHLRYADFEDYKNNFLDTLKKTIDDHNEERNKKLNIIYKDADDYKELKDLIQDDIYNTNEGYKYREMTKDEKTNTNIFLYFNYINGILKNDPYFYIKLLLKKKGFNIKYNYNVVDLDVKATKKDELKRRLTLWEEYKQGKEPEEEKQLITNIKNKIEYLGVEGEEESIYIVYLLDDYKYISLYTSIKFIKFYGEASEIDATDFILFNGGNDYDFVNGFKNKLFYLKKLNDMINFNIYQGINEPLKLKTELPEERKNEALKIYKMFDMKGGASCVYDVYKNVYKFINMICKGFNLFDGKQHRLAGNKYTLYTPNIKNIKLLINLINKKGGFILQHNKLINEVEDIKKLIDI
jgi:hypothetical protein